MKSVEEIKKQINFIKADDASGRLNLGKSLENKGYLQALNWVLGDEMR